MPDILIELDPQRNCDDRIAFTIDFRDGTISEPFVRYAHERNSLPEWIWRGDGSLEFIHIDAVTTEAWQEFLKAARPKVDELVEFHADRNRAGADLHSAFEEFVAGFWSARENDVPSLQDPGEWFFDILRAIDVDGDPSGIDDATQVFISEMDGERVIQATTTDQELASIVSALDSVTDCSVVRFADGAIADWVAQLRDYCRTNDPNWGELTPVLRRLMTEGESRIRQKSKGKYNPDGAEVILIATRPTPADGEWEPAVLDFGYPAWRQWRAAGIEPPADIRGQFEQCALRSIEARSRSLADDHLLADSHRVITDLEAKARRLEKELAAIRGRIEVLRSEGAAARHASHVNACSYFVGQCFPDGLNGDCAFSDPDARAGSALNLVALDLNRVGKSDAPSDFQPGGFRVRAGSVVGPKAARVFLDDLQSALPPPTTPPLDALRDSVAWAIDFIDRKC